MTEVLHRNQNLGLSTVFLKILEDRILTKLVSIMVGNDLYHGEETFSYIMDIKNHSLSNFFIISSIGWGLIY